MLDVNLRAPWWDIGEVSGILGRSAIAKINQDELFALLADRHAPGARAAAAIDAARVLRQNHDLDAVVLTCGADGAAWVDRERVHRTEACPPPGFVDAVGAGDAFTAVVVAGLGASRPPEAILPQAAGFAAAVCAIRGATDRDPEFYDDVRRFVAPDRAMPREASPQGGPRG